MSTTLDGQKLFDEHELKIEAGSFKRASIERAAPSLNGVISIDLGRRSRIIKQTGSIRGKSRSHINERILAISDHMNGNTHTLITESREFHNLRMDSFRVIKERINGTGIVVEYEITYTQLT